ncbi:MAG: zinc-binding dehydrogenase [Candidatus Methanomethylicaceae archaeon]
MKINDYIAIIGTGIIGLCTLQVVKIAGAGKIICSDLVESRLKLAEKIGAKYLINAKEIDPVEKIMEITNEFISKYLSLKFIF